MIKCSKYFKGGDLIMAKKELEELKKKLFVSKENGWLDLNNNTKQDVFSYAKGYINYLNNSKQKEKLYLAQRKLQKKTDLKI